MATLTKTGFTREALAALPVAGEPGWAKAQRERALDEFEALPLPSQETEEWRYTDLSELDLAGFAPFAPGTVADNLDGLPEDVLAAAGQIGDRAGLLVQHNSQVATAHLDPALAARGVYFGGLDRAFSERPHEVVDRLHALVPTNRTLFTALHGAFRAGGVLVHVPAGVRLELPLQSIVWLDADGGAVFPHTLIVAEEGSEVAYIDRFVSPPLTRALSDAVVEIHAEAGARVRYAGLQEWGDGVTHLSVQRARVGRDAEVRSVGVAFGASLARAEVESVLAGDGGSSELLGIYFGDGEQHLDHRSIQDHVGSNTSSDLLYKGALRDRSRAIYSGTVIIEEGAHHCNAYQTNRNVLLSESAKANSIPNLEILTNDPVRCGHAASVGPVDEEQVFYLQSRGIAPAEAERLIVKGFFQEVIDRVPLAEVAAGLEAAIDAELAREQGPEAQ